MYLKINLSKLFAAVGFKQNICRSNILNKLFLRKEFSVNTFFLIH